MAEFGSAFSKQVRFVTNGRPLLYCNGTLHLIQVLVTYANHFIELVEIFPGNGKSPPSIERQFIYSYAEPVRYFPIEEKQPKVQVVCLEQLNSAFFAIYVADDPSKFGVYDL